jgi:hypothetical protein
VVDGCELLGSFTVCLFESSDQVRVIRDHLRVLAVCRNFRLIGPDAQEWIISCCAKERRNIVTPIEHVAVSRSENLRSLDAFDCMVDPTIRNKAVYKQKRSERAIAGSRRSTSRFQRSAVPDFVGARHNRLSV